MLERWGGWLVLIGLAVATTLLLRSLEQEAQARRPNTDQVPDYAMKNFTTTTLDEQGQLKQQLAAQMMTAYPNTHTDLTAPTVIFYKDGHPTWTVQAEQGRVSSDNNIIWLLGTTTFQREAPTPQNTLQIISRNVRVQRDIEYAETEAPTTILSSYGETHSVGLQVFMQTQRIELLSQVRGRYVLE